MVEETRIKSYVRATRKSLTVRLDEPLQDFFTRHPEIAGKALKDLVTDSLKKNIHELYPGELQ